MLYVLNNQFCSIVWPSKLAKIVQFNTIEFSNYSCGQSLFDAVYSRLDMLLNVMKKNNVVSSGHAYTYAFHSRMSLIYTWALNTYVRYTDKGKNYPLKYTLKKKNEMKWRKKPSIIACIQFNSSFHFRHLFVRLTWHAEAMMLG